MRRGGALAFQCRDNDLFFNYFLTLNLKTRDKNDCCNWLGNIREGQDKINKIKQEVTLNG